jgi:ectoine hydroxylase-related dioxygenase (phytanoyl-CoA dioxygenase family)
MTSVAPPAGAVAHPWNQGFSWELPSHPPTTLDPADRAAFDSDGYLVLPEVVEPELLASVTDQLDRYEASVDRFLATQEGERMTIAERGAITFSPHAVLRSPAARTLAHHPAFVGAAADLLGPDVNLYWDQAVYKKPEKPRRFPWHQDNGYTFVEPQYYLTCWVALTDATVDNGCPWVLPGVHRAGTLLHRWVDPIGWECLTEPEKAVAAEAPAGGAVVFSSLTPHLTGPNTTSSVRKAYILQYAVVGTEVLEGNWAAGAPPTARVACDDPDRQFPVLRGGHPIGEAAGG